MNEKSHDNLSLEKNKTYLKVNTLLESYSDITQTINSEKLNLSSFINEYHQKVESIKNSDGVLKLGIVGQVKAGKSSFINSLLFNGENILPKASTPMTAALTIMSYSETPYAEVEFYTEGDWQTIQDLAKKYRKELAKLKEKEKNRRDSFVGKLNIKADIKSDKDLHEEICSQLHSDVVAAYELYEESKKNNVDIKKYLGKNQTISDVQSNTDLIGKLNQFVGAGGKYTPFTRNTKLYLKIEALKGIVLIDTPGVNDPIISRGSITRKYLSKCDCVFLLSYAGQFMGQEDTNFLINNLPNEGIRKIILIGSKFDSVLFDESSRYQGNLREALQDINSKLIIQAEESIIPQIDANPNLPLMDSLRKSLPPIFISSICYNIAQKYPNSLDEYEKHILNKLMHDFPDYFDKHDHEETIKSSLIDLANINNLKDKRISELIIETELILKDRLNDLITGQHREFVNQFNHIYDCIETNLDNLRNSNVEGLREQLYETKRLLQKVNDDIEQEFFDLSLNLKKEINSIIREIEEAKYRFKKIEIETKSEWVKDERYGFLWLKKRSIYEDVNYASIYDAIDNVNKYSNKANRTIAEKWDSLINLKSFERSILKIVTEGLDTSSESYDKKHILGPLKNALSEFIIDPYHIDSDKFESLIRNNFSGTTVKGSDTKALVNILQESISEIFNTINTEVTRQKNNLIESIERNGKEFINKVTKKSESDIEELIKQLQNQEHFVELHESLLSELNSIRVNL